MQMFSRLTMLFVFLGITLMFVGGTADAQDPFLKVVDSEGFDEGSTGGDVSVTFQAGFDGAGQPGIPLRITATNVSNIMINGAPATVPGTYTTGLAGLLTVTGEVPSNVNAEIKAVWQLGGGELEASVSCPCLIGQPALEVYTDVDGAVYAVGDTVEVRFLASIDGQLASGVQLTIAFSGISDVVVSNDGITDVSGGVTVTGKIVRATGVYIEATWEWNEATQLFARAEFTVRDPLPEGEPALLIDAGGHGAVYDVGDTVEVTFLAEIDGQPTSGVELTIAFSGISDVVVSNGGVTDVFGGVTVTGKIVQATVGYIDATWGDLTARAEFTVSAPLPTLEVYTAVDDAVYAIGDTVEVTFLASIDRQPTSGIQLTIEHFGIGDVNISNDGVTNAIGTVTVTGTVISYHEVSISAVWLSENFPLSSTAVFFVELDPRIIFSPVMGIGAFNPKFPLTVGDTFTRMILIENKSDWQTVPVSAWRMSIGFDPLVLEVVEIIEGDFLESDGKDALYTAAIVEGGSRISVTQERIGQPLSGIPLARGETGELLTIRFKVLSVVTEDALGLSSAQLYGLKVDEDGDGIYDPIRYNIKTLDVFDTTVNADVDGNGVVNILDLALIASNFGERGPNVADVNRDGVVDVIDLALVAAAFADTAAAPETWHLNPENMPTRAAVEVWLRQAQQINLTDPTFQRGILVLEQLLAALTPKETVLLSNYPNPFNPETWIPYRLSEASDVTVAIYAVDGRLIRTLALGHQPAGLYQRKSRAAYWDGRNAFGERVASGLYFYTLTAGKFSATGKMLVQK